MKFGSVCSGIEAASVAWEPLGWSAAWLSEIEAFPCSVLAHHWPDVPNLGDMTTIEPRIRAGEISAPEIFTGGTPCQAFSVAGKRGSLSDDRGNLSLTFCEIANAIDDVRSARGEDAAIIVWENVPGVLSTSDNAFGCFLAGLAGDDQPIEPGPRPEQGRSSAHWTWKKDAGQHCAKWPDAGVVAGPRRTVAWRVINAQYFGLAQRRRRVFVVASARDGFNPGAVLFEFDGVRRDSPPSREAGEGAAAGTGSGAQGGGFPGTDGACAGHVQPVCFAGNQQSKIAATLQTTCDDYSRADGFNIVVHGTQDPDIRHDQAHTLGRNSGQENAVLSVSLRGREGGGTAELGDDKAGCLRASSGGGDKPHVLAPVCVTGDVTHTLKAEGFDGSEDGTGRVRRLTPVECERLQGFPDGHTLVPHNRKPAKDGPRYKAIGNSWAVNCARWIGQRINNHINSQ